MVEERRVWTAAPRWVAAVRIMAAAVVGPVLAGLALVVWLAAIALASLIPPSRR